MKYNSRLFSHQHDADVAVFCVGFHFCTSLFPLLWCFFSTEVFRETSGVSKSQQSRCCCPGDSSSSILLFLVATTAALPLLQYYVARRGRYRSPGHDHLSRRPTTLETTVQTPSPSQRTTTITTPKKILESLVSFRRYVSFTRRGRPWRPWEWEYGKDTAQKATETGWWERGHGRECRCRGRSPVSIIVTE